MSLCSISSRATPHHSIIRTLSHCHHRRTAASASSHYSRRRYYHKDSAFREYRENKSEERRRKDTEPPAASPQKIVVSTQQNVTRRTTQHSQHLISHEQVQHMKNADLTPIGTLEQQFYAPKPAYEQQHDETIIPVQQRVFIQPNPRQSDNNFYIFTDSDVDALHSVEYTYPFKNNPFFARSRQYILESLQYHHDENVLDRDMEIVAAQHRYIWQFPWNRSVRLMRLTSNRLQYINDQHRARIRAEWRFEFERCAKVLDYKQVEAQIQKGIRLANFYLQKYGRADLTGRELDALMIREEDLPPPPVMPPEAANKESQSMFSDLF